MMLSDIVSMTHGITIDHLIRAFKIYSTAVTLNPVILGVVVQKKYMTPLVNVTLNNGCMIKQIIAVIGETEVDSPPEITWDDELDPALVVEDRPCDPVGEYCFVSDSISANYAVVNVVCHVYPQLTHIDDDYFIEDHHVFPVLAKAMSIMTMELGDIVGSGAYEKFYINIINYMNMNRSKPGNTGISYMETSYGLS